MAVQVERYKGSRFDLEYYLAAYGVSQLDHGRRMLIRAGLMIKGPNQIIQ